MDFEGVEVADERLYLMAEHLARNKRGETGRIGRDEGRRHHVDAGVELGDDLLVGSCSSVIDSTTSTSE